MSETPLKKPAGSLSRDEFVARYGGVYERSPWVAEAAFYKARDISTLPALQAAMRNIVDEAPEAQRLQLMRAHPDLTIAAADISKLTAHSAAEQRGAGLLECSPEEMNQFAELNGGYKTKFGFPFIVAVKGMTRDDILAAFKRRIENSRAAEFKTALEQIHKIAAIRLAALEEMN